MNSSLEDTKFILKKYNITANKKLAIFSFVRYNEANKNKENKEGERKSELTFDMW